MKKKRFILLLIVILIIISILLIYNRKQTIKNWHNIENDFNIVNEFVIDYYSNQETNSEENIFVYFYGEKMIDTNTSERIKINNDIEQRLERITNYINTHSVNKKYWDTIFIKVEPLSIRYSLFDGGAHIVYYREKKPSILEMKLQNLEHLSGNWYKIHSNN